jgi:hypothetical protein
MKTIRGIHDPGRSVVGLAHSQFLTEQVFAREDKPLLQARRERRTNVPFIRSRHPSAYLVGALAPLLLASIIGCAAPDGTPGAPEAETTGSKNAALLGYGALWPNGVVPVCWETGLSTSGDGQAVNPHTRPDWSTLSAVVRDTLRSTWGRVANIEFVWFGDCPSNSPEGNAGYLAINMGGGNNASCGSTALGYQGSDTWTRMRLDTGCVYGNPDVWSEFRAQVMHETGHALGFQHEFDRADNPHNTGCTVGDGNFVGNTGPTYGTAFDIHSIMNYSYDQGAPDCKLPRPYRLSEWDIIGAQNAYGRRLPGTLVAGSGSCLDIPQPYAPGGLLQIYQCNGGSNQAWALTTGGWVENTAFASFLDVPWASTSPGVQLDSNNQNWPATPNQIWQPTNGYQIRGIGDMCLDIPYGNITSNQIVQIYGCHGGAPQQWRARSDGTIRPAANESFCLDVPYGSAYAGNVLQLYPCNGGTSQQFVFDDSGAILFGDMCLDVQHGTPTPGNVVQLHPCKSAGDLSRANQLWHLTTSVTGSNGLCMEAQGNSSLNHTPIIQDTCDATAVGQTWDYYVQGFTGF